MSPLLVARTPYCVKGVKLGHSQFIGWQACGMWAELNISGCIQAQLKKKRKEEARFTLLFSCLFSIYCGAYYCSKNKPIVYLNAVRCKFRSRNRPLLL